MKKEQPMKTIEAVLTATTTEVITIATKILLGYYKAGKVFVCKDDFVYAVGESPICVVSHCDTVRDRQITGIDKKPHYKAFEEKPVDLVLNRNVLRNKNGVLGADDRAGVFGCLELVRRAVREGKPLPSVILTNGEESGGLGVGVFVSTEVFLKHDKGRTKLFVEMDRCNGNEWVTYGPRLPQPVIDYVESFGFKSGHGSYSDIADLQDEYLIPAVNLSIGYYGQHGPNECLHLDEMWLTINRVWAMMEDPIDKLYPAGKKYVYVAPVRTTSYDSSYYERNNGGSKNVGGGRVSGNVSNSLPVDKKGSMTLDSFLEYITFGGYCNECGYVWSECDCHHILTKIATYLTDDEIKDLRENYMSKDDTLYEELGAYLAAIDEGDEAATTETKGSDTPDQTDPHHVGKDGEQLLLLESKE